MPELPASLSLAESASMETIFMASISKVKEQAPPAEVVQ
jgi:hypothetical protein